MDGMRNRVMGMFLFMDYAVSSTVSGQMDDPFPP
jgi:hypothetical protein